MRVDGIDQSGNMINTQNERTYQMNDFSNAERIKAVNVKFEGQNNAQNTDFKDSLNNPQELKKILEELMSKLSYLNSQLKIEMDNDIKQPVIKIMDINTNQVIRQIPPDYMINIIKNINKLLGVLFDEKA